MKRVIFAVILVGIAWCAFAQDDVPVFTDEDLGGSPDKTITIEGMPTERTRPATGDKPYTAGFENYRTDAYVDPKWLTVRDVTVEPMTYLYNGVPKVKIFENSDDIYGKFVTVKWRFTVESPVDSPPGMTFAVNYEVLCFNAGRWCQNILKNSTLSMNNFTERAAPNGMYKKIIEDQGDLNYLCWDGGTYSIRISLIEIQ